MERGVKADFIAEFLQYFKQRAIKPTITFTNKDFSEINTFCATFPDAKHQLCFWHVLRAGKTCLSILQRRPAFYNVEDFTNEFGEKVDKNFVPEGQNNSVVTT
jgi:transposase-like protein